MKDKLPTLPLPIIYIMSDYAQKKNGPISFSFLFILELARCPKRYIIIIPFDVINDVFVKSILKKEKDFK